MSDDEDEPKEIEAGMVNIIIPQCCREGWDDCKHAVHKEREKPKNIAV